jgi:hypothetical protein
MWPSVRYARDLCFEKTDSKLTLIFLLRKLAEIGGDGISFGLFADSDGVA